MIGVMICILTTNKSNNLQNDSTLSFNDLNAIDEVKRNIFELDPDSDFHQFWKLEAGVLRLFHRAFTGLPDLNVLATFCPL